MANKTVEDILLTHINLREALIEYKFDLDDLLSTYAHEHDVNKHQKFWHMFFDLVNELETIVEDL